MLIDDVLDISTGSLCVDSMSINYDELDEAIYEYVFGESAYTTYMKEMFVQKTKEQLFYPGIRSIMVYVVKGRRELVSNTFEYIHTVDEAGAVLRGEIEEPFVILHIFINLNNSMTTDSVVCVIPKHGCTKTLFNYSRKWHRNNRKTGIYGFKFAVVSILFRKILDYYLFNKKEVELKTNKT